MVVAVEKSIQPVLPSNTGGIRGRPVKWMLCIISAGKLTAVTDELNKLNLVGGMTVTDLRGAGREAPDTGVFLGKKFTVPYQPKVKVELAVEAGDVERVEKLIQDL